MNDPVGFWLTVATTCIITVVGVWLTNRTARRIARTSGALDKPKLSVSLCGLPTRKNGAAMSLFFVVPRDLERPARAYLTALVHNGGTRAAEEVLARLTMPRLTTGPDEQQQITTHGLAPGRQVKRETIDELGMTSVYWPHIAPGATEAFRQQFKLESTRLAFQLDNVATSDGGKVSVSGNAEVEWTSNLGVESKEGTRPGASLSIRVVVGETLESAAEALAKKVHEDRRSAAKVDAGRRVGKLVAYAHLWISARPRREPVAYLVVPHLDPVLTNDGAVTLLYEETPETSKYYAIIQTWQGLALMPTTKSLGLVQA